MIYHFLPYNNVYSNQFIDFMNENKNRIVGNHKFVFLWCDKSEQKNKFVEPQFIRITTLFDMLRLLFSTRKTDSFIIHNYSHPYLYFAFTFFCCKLKSTVWKIWGGDLYFYKEPKNNIKYKIYEVLRKFCIKRFGFISSTSSEYMIVKNIYKTKGINIKTFYPRVFADKPVKENNNFVSILVGNSRDVSNEHIEALNMLSKFKDENIKIYMPLSYGDTPSGYIEKVMSEGYKIFKQNYIPITELIPFDDYLNFLTKMDIMVCNHRRQQAWGNLLVFLRNKRKIFIRKDISTETDFNDYGLSFSLTDDIENMDFKEFIHFSMDEGLKNNKIIDDLFSHNNLVKQWNKLFSKVIEN